MKKNLQKNFINLTLVLSIIFGGFSTVYSQTLYNVIQGKVWIENDNSQDGLMQSGERKLAGIVVSMYSDGDFQPKGNAMTDSLGNYTLENYVGIGTYNVVFDFPLDGFGTDGSDCATIANVGSDFTKNSRGELDENGKYSFNITISSPAAVNANFGLLRRVKTITHCGMHYAQVSWPVPTNIYVRKIPTYASIPSNGATFWSSVAVFNPTIKYENQGVLPDNMTLSLGVNARVFRADQPVNMGTSLAMNPSYFLSEELPAYDGILDYGGLSGRSVINKNSNSSTFFGTVSGTTVNNNYTGVGYAAFPTTMIATTTISGGGNLSTQVSTYAAAGACMVYRFASNPLPITLLSFNAAKDKNGDVKLNWVTSNEENNLGFEVEYSLDGMIWNKLDFVRTKSSNGTSLSALSYSFLHTHAAKGVNFYRLKQIDLNGSSSFSKIATINLDTKNTEVRIFPNPMQGSGTLNIDGLGAATSIEVYNMAGTKIYNVNSKNNNTQKIDMSNVTSGIYNVVVKDMDSGESIIQKVVK